jgi:hypothetical protein
VFLNFGSEVLAVVAMKGIVSWVETTYSLEEHTASIFRFKEEAKQDTLSGVLHGFLLDLQDGGNVFLQNFRMSPIYTVLQHTSLYFCNFQNLFS